MIGRNGRVIGRCREPETASDVVCFTLATELGVYQRMPLRPDAAADCERRRLLVSRASIKVFGDVVGGQHGREHNYQVLVLPPDGARDVPQLNELPLMLSEYEME